jgi:hypothetical protein
MLLQCCHEQPDKKVRYNRWSYLAFIPLWRWRSKNEAGGGQKVWHLLNNYLSFICLSSCSFQIIKTNKLKSPINAIRPVSAWRWMKHEVG